MGLDLHEELAYHSPPFY